MSEGREPIIGVDIPGPSSQQRLATWASLYEALISVRSPGFDDDGDRIWIVTASAPAVGGGPRLEISSGEAPSVEMARQLLLQALDAAGSLTP